MNDAELLREYRGGSEAAFETLVGRHVDWIYSAAVRRVRDRHLAEDVTQAVFIALSQYAKAYEGGNMSAWLFQVMRHASANVLRTESRRKAREAAAAQMSDGGDSDWQRVSPLLDEAVAKLRDRDRKAVLLRFYQKMSWEEVGGALGISDEGARKRVARAIGKLRAALVKRGVDVPVASLAGGLGTYVTHAAPANFAVALGGGNMALARGAIHSMMRRTWVFAGAGAVAVVVVGVLAVWLTAQPTAMPTTLPSPVPVAATEPDFSPVVEATAATRPANISAEELIAGIKKAETQFTNVYVKDFETTKELLPKGEKEWQSTPIVVMGSAWFDGAPRGRMRVFLSRCVEPWVNGAAPFLDRSIDDSWDGKEGREVQVGIFTKRGLLLANTAQITATPPMMIDYYGPVYQWTGLAFTPQYWRDESEFSTSTRPRPLLSATLENMLKKPNVTIVAQEVNGFDAIRIKLVHQVGWIAFWIDPSHGFSIIKYEYFVSRANVSRTGGLDVNGLKEVSPNIWFPMQASVLMQGAGMSPDGQQFLPGYSRLSYRAIEVVVNDPKFDANIFQTKIPIGYLVTDVRTSTRRDYLLLDDGIEKDLHRGDTLPQPHPATRPDAVVGP